VLGDLADFAGVISFVLQALTAEVIAEASKRCNRAGLMELGVEMAQGYSYRQA